jgi:dipeptidyl aminopeptidase/acylaminoacyl peptidase
MKYSFAIGTPIHLSSCLRFVFGSVLGATLALVAITSPAAAKTETFSIHDVLSAPFPTDLQASPKGNRAAWIANDRGSRNLWVADVTADGGHSARQVTAYIGDDGMDMGEVRWTPDTNSIIYTRGGSFEGGGAVNTLSLPQGAPAQEIWMVGVNGGAPRKLGAGHAAVVSPAGDTIAYLSGEQIWVASLSSTEEAAQLIHDRGKGTSIVFSPDGKRLAFVSARTDHAFVGVYDFAKRSITWLSPSIDEDDAIAWSPDSKYIAFIRSPSNNPYLFAPRITGDPWSIWVADAADGTARRIWIADGGVGSVFSPLESDRQLLWSAGGKIIFPWEKTGWRTLYTVSMNAPGAKPLTPGNFEVVEATLSPKGDEVVYASNAGDLNGRHLWHVSVVTGKVSPLTSGGAIEDSPDVTGEGRIVAFQADARQPLEPVFLGADGKAHVLAPPLPPTFPLKALVEPQNVSIKSPDGMQVPGQLFLPAGGTTTDRHPAVVFFHGGPPRQMFAAWSPMDAYSYMYGFNQYLANKGYVVLSVNYRGGAGYGLKFREPPRFGTAGASEYQDILGAAQFLRARSDVDPRHVGVYGGSYGGLMTGLALSRSSDLFAAGVDYAGVGNWLGLLPPSSAPDAADVSKLAYESSPIATAAQWRSPVLFIQADDDRNVPFHQTVELAEALRNLGHAQVDQLIIPDEIHDLLRRKSWDIFFDATDRYFDKYLRGVN